MFRRFLPKTTDFFYFFEQHSLCTREVCELLLQMCSEQKNIQDQADKIKEIELKADLLTHQCTEALHKTFITPLDRSDILTLIKRMDDIIDFIYGSTQRMLMYEITEIRPEAKELAEILLASVNDICEALTHMRDFKNAPLIQEKCINIHHLEDKADTLLRNTIARLFREEDKPILVIKWKEIYERLEKATDRCDDVANILEKVVIEST